MLELSSFSQFTLLKDWNKKQQCYSEKTLGQLESNILMYWKAETSHFIHMDFMSSGFKKDKG